MNLNLSKKKKSILIIISVVLVIILVAVIIVKNTRVSKEKTLVTSKDTYEIKGGETLKFKGTSIISDEQRILVDHSQGELKDIKVTDGQVIKAGDVLFSYYNTAVEEQIEKYNRQITANNDKISKTSNDKEKNNTSISQLETDLNDVINQLNQIQADISQFSHLEEKTNEEKNNEEIYSELIKMKDSLEGKQIEISQQIELLKNQVSGLNTQISTYEEDNKNIVD